MKKLTKKQRNKTYKLLLKSVLKGEKYVCCLSEYLGINPIYLYEFQLFKPTREECGFLGNSWFEESNSNGLLFYDEETKETGQIMRQIALILCIEMTK